MADLIGHPWMMEAIPAKDDILKEFANRSEKVRARAEAEKEQERQAKKSNPSDRTRRDIVINDKIYASGDLSEQDMQNPKV